MSALTVTLGADITALKRAMAGATELVGASASRMGRLTCHRSLQNAPPVITSKCTTPDGCFLMD